MTSNYLTKQMNSLFVELEKNHDAWEDKPKEQIAKEKARGRGPIREKVIFHKMEAACQRIAGMSKVDPEEIEMIFDEMIADYLDVLERKNSQMKWSLDERDELRRQQRLEECPKGNGFYIVSRRFMDPRER